MGDYDKFAYIGCLACSRSPALLVAGASAALASQSRQHPSVPLVFLVGCDRSALVYHEHEPARSVPPASTLNRRSRRQTAGLTPCVMVPSAHSAACLVNPRFGADRPTLQSFAVGPGNSAAELVERIARMHEI